MATNNMNDLTNGTEAISTQPSATMPRYMIIHRVECPGSTPDHSGHPHISLYLDVPRLYAGDNKASPLRGLKPDKEAQLRARTDPDVSFTIHRIYNCLEYHDALFESLQETLVDPVLPGRSSQIYLIPTDAFDAVEEREYMEVSTHLKDAIEAVKGADTRQDSLEKSLLLGWEREHNMVAPYLHFYHTRKLLRDHVTQLPERQSQHINLLLNYLDEHLGLEYQEAEKLFDDELVSRKHFHKLFGPREIVVTVENGHHIAMVSRYPPTFGSNPIRLECETWKFDGRFAKYKRTITVPWPKHATELDKVPIKSLNIFPLKFDQRLEDRLRKRGEFCWQLRKPRLVLYNAPRELLDYRMENGRYMVDINTYRRFPHKYPIDNMAAEDAEEYLSPEVTESDSPPTGNFALLLPPTTYGLGLYDKKWGELAIEYATDVVWDDGMFHKLNIPQDDRDILGALLLGNKASRDDMDILGALLLGNKASRDAVPVRGQGRVIHLYGGLGTGKTFAAEALAELARKPLYQLLPYEIGMEPNEVENNIKEAFYLGKIWDAVIVLEDCDVFIDWHRLSDLEGRLRASIIVQAISNYPGVVILTTRGADLSRSSLQHRVQKEVLLEHR